MCIMTQKGHLTLLRVDAPRGYESCFTPLFFCRPLYTPSISVHISGLFSRFGKGWKPAWQPQILNLQGFPGLSLIYHKGIRSRPEPSNPAWTSAHFQRFWGTPRSLWRFSSMPIQAWKQKSRNCQRWMPFFDTFSDAENKPIAVWIAVRRERGYQFCRIYSRFPSFHAVKTKNPASKCRICGGAYRIRTGDLYNANVAR